MKRVGWVAPWIATATAVLAVAAEPVAFEFQRYNGRHSGLVSEMEPIVRGPLTIRLSSPRYDLDILANRLEFEPASDGLHHVRGWARFSGDGDLEADVRLAAFPASFADRVVILEQEKQVEALARLERHESGYAVTLEELPKTVAVAIESELAGRLVSFCVKFSRFTIGDAGCGALDRLLSNPRLPLPEPGTRVIVSRDYFLAEEIETFERYLDSTESGSSGVDQTGGVVDAVGSP